MEKSGSVEETVIIIKPDAVERKLVGQIISRFEEEGLSLIMLRSVHWTKELSMSFFHVHQ